MGQQLDTGIAGVATATRGLEEGTQKYEDAARIANQEFLAGLQKEIGKDGGKFQKMYGDLYNDMFGNTDLTVDQVK